MTESDRLLRLRGGLPSWIVAAATPVVALGLLGQRFASDGMRQQLGEPASPWLVALVTLGLAGFVTARALTQRADLDATGIRCRNLLVTYKVDWADVERLEVVRRVGLVVVEVHIRNLRRHHRLGAVTRFSGPDADEVLGLLAAVSPAGERLVESGTDHGTRDRES